MLVVLTIVALMTALAGPSLVSNINSVQFQKDAEARINRLSQYRVQAILNQRNFYFETAQDPRDFGAVWTPVRYDLPEGWFVSGATILISSSGICTGGRVSISDDEGRFAIYDVANITCRAERVSD